jgi:hypothetical protein
VCGSHVEAELEHVAVGVLEAEAGAFGRWGLGPGAVVAIGSDGGAHATGDLPR